MLEQQANIRKMIRGMFKGLLISMVVTALLIVVMALLMYVMDIGSMGVKIGVHIIYVAAALTGGWVAGRTIGFKKFLWGLLAGFLYYLLVCIIAALSGEMAETEFAIQVVPVLFCLGSGMLGGMLG